MSYVSGTIQYVCDPESSDKRDFYAPKGTLGGI